MLACKCPNCRRLMELPDLLHGEPGRPAGACESCGISFLFDFTGPDPRGTEPAVRFAQELKLPGYTAIGVHPPGGMGFLYTAVREEDNALCAIKVMPPRLASYEPLVERFRREVRAMRALNHPNIMPVFDAFTDGEIPWFSMPYMAGRTLKARLAEVERLPLMEVIAIAAPLAEAVDHIHRSGYLHRDVKPSNIILSSKGDVILLDFGIAAEAGKDHDITDQGVTLGTPAYNAPEVFEKGEATALSDQYSLAVILYEMLTGMLPMGVFDLPRQHNGDLPEDSEHAVLRALRHSPADRHESVGKFWRAFSRRTHGFSSADGREPRDFVRDASKPLADLLSVQANYEALQGIARKRSGLSRVWGWITFGSPK